MASVTKRPLEDGGVDADGNAHAAAKVAQQQKPKKARRLRNQSPEQRILAEYRIQIEACARTTDALGALALYKKMKEESVVPSAYIFRVLISICVKAEQSTELMTDIFQVYEDMKADTAFSKGIDETIYSALVKLCSKAGDFERCHALIAELETKSVLPKLRTFAPLLHAYSEAGDLEKCLWTQSKLVEHSVELTEPEYLSLLKVCTTNGDATQFYAILDQYIDTVLQPDRSAWDVLKEWFQSEAAQEEGKKWTCTVGTVDDKGVCSVTGDQLQSIELPPALEAELLEKIESLVTTDEKRTTQWGEFKTWLDEHGPFDVVIDAANVGYFNQNYEGGGFNYKQIETLLTHYEQQQKRVLIVLHKRRTTDEQVPAEHRAMVAQWAERCIMFNCLPGNNDDWYWLYAAVRFGGRTLAVTNDEMRDHHFQMIHDRAFSRWKERHQTHYEVNGSTRWQVKEPTPFSIRPQRIGEKWHFPCTDSSEWLDAANAERGRWSAPEAVESVDLDTLLAAPSPSPQQQRRKKYERTPDAGKDLIRAFAICPNGFLYCVVCRPKSKSEKSRFHWTAGDNQPIDLDAAIEADSGNGYASTSCVLYAYVRLLTELCVHFDNHSSKKTSFRNNNANGRRAVPPPRRNDLRRKSTSNDDMDYHSYDDPGYMAADHNIELMHFDSDCILGSPLNSPSVIHARWGEPVDDPDEESVCTDFRPNPFKLGFCVNCQKQHDVTAGGDVVSEKNYKKIARPVVSKTAANALDNPAALENAPAPKENRESDVDLAALLAQRRDILLKLGKLEQEKAMRATTHIPKSSIKSTIANLRRMPSHGRPTSGPQSLVVNRASSVALGVLSPRLAPSSMYSKSVSVGGYLDDEEPAQNDCHLFMLIMTHLFYANAAEEELLALLKTRGVLSLCDAISREINYVWAVVSGFRTLAAVGHFYFACGSQTFGYNPAYDFFTANGMQLALFTLRKFIHNEHVLVPVLDCVRIYTKLHVDGALEFLAVPDAKEILMKCVCFHDNKHDVISTACQALGSLVLNALDVRLIYAIFNFTGFPRIVEALASHLDTEEIAVEGSQLLAKLAAIREAYVAINHAKVLDLAYVALFAYNGPQHRHTRLEIQKTMYPFQKRTLYDSKELTHREQASRVGLMLYAGFVVCFLLTSALSLYDHSTSDLVVAVKNALVHKPWPSTSAGHSGGPSSSVGRTLHDVHTVQDVWSYLLHPLHDTLFQSQWYNGDRFVADDVDSQLRIVDRANILLGGLQLRVIRVQNATSSSYLLPYPQTVELKSTIDKTPSFIDQWSSSNDDDSDRLFHGRLASYPMMSGYRQFIPRLSNTSVTDSNFCSLYCQLTKLQSGHWLDASVRALFVEFNLYNPVVDVHCTSTILFEFPATGGAALVSTKFTPIHLDLYPGIFVFTSPRFYVEIAVLAGVFWFTAKQIVKILRYRAFYFVVVPHVVDFAIIALWIAVIVSHVQFLVTASSHALRIRVASASASGDTSKLSFVDLNAIADLAQTERVLMAWTALLMGWWLLRFAKCLKPLKPVLVKFERAEKMLQTFLVVLVLGVLGFAHAGMLLFPFSSSSSSSVASGFRDFSVSMYVKQGLKWLLLSLLKRSHHPKGDDLSGNPSILLRVLFQLAMIFVVLNMVVAILRERFDSTCRTKSTDADEDANGENGGDSLHEMQRSSSKPKA
ncbi:Polycystin cation channel, partial [Globisporangium splendens]